MSEMNQAYRRMANSLSGRKSQKKIYIINGAPGSGKTTFVKKSRKKGDLVVDMDLLVDAMLAENTGHPDFDSVMDEALAVRETLYREIENKRGKWNQAFIITSTPDKERLKRLKKRMDAEIVEMPTTRGECIKRVKQDTARKEPEKDIKLIEKWFNERV